MKSLTPEQVEDIHGLANYMKGAGGSITQIRKRLPAKLRKHAQSAGPWPMFHHPLCVIVPFFGGEGEIEQIVKSIEAKEERLEEFKKLGKPHAGLFLYERPYRFEAIHGMRSEGCFKDNEEEFWECLAEVWIDSENIYQHHREWCELLDEAAQHNFMMEAMMNQDEWELLMLLSGEDKNLEVYRGAVEGENERGLSWTMDRERAGWFAERFGKGGKVWKTTVSPRTDIVAIFTGRNEDEVVLRPSFLTDALIEEA